MSVSIYDYIEKIVPQENILFDEPMSRHTTFRVGGAAKCLIKVNNKEQMKKLIPYLHMTGQNFFILGNGSNLLVGDKGYSGILVKLGEGMESVTVEGERMKISAGTLLSKAASAARENELTGMEFASGIPGTVGGAIVMNAGAYGGEMKQIVESVEVMNMEGEILVLDNDTMEFGYRKSVIKSRPFIVLETVLCLQKGKQEEISSKMEELSRLRREKQPLKYVAGKLIMDAGLRGFSIGGAKVSEKHCGFIVNSGNATAADIREVIDEVQKCVKAKFGVTLEREVIYLGDF